MKLKWRQAGVGGGEGSIKYKINLISQVCYNGLVWKLRIHRILGLEALTGHIILSYQRKTKIIAAAALPQAPRAHTEPPATEPPQQPRRQHPQADGTGGRQPRPQMSCDNFREDNKLEHEWGLEWYECKWTKYEKRTWSCTHYFTIISIFHECFPHFRWKGF